MAFTIVTDNGLAAIAAAQVAESFVDLTQLAVGDGGGAEIVPVSTMTELVNERWRGELNRIYVSDTNANWLVIEAQIPADVGGWDIREVGVIAADGTLIGVGSYPLTNKPAPGGGSEKELYVRMILEVSNAANVTQQIDASLVYLTQWHLDQHADRTDNPHGVGPAQIGAETPAGAQDKVDTHAGRNDNPHNVTRDQIGAEASGAAAAYMAAHEGAADPHEQYETSAEAQAKVNAHAIRIDNPHDVTQEQIGYTAADVLAKLLTVDGPDSGINADLLDGLESSQLARYSAGGTLPNALALAAWVVGYSGAANVDHIWHDDNLNTWHFCSDSAFKANGNATVRAGAFNEDGQLLSAKYARVADFISSKASSGYLRLPGGIVLQWAYVATTADNQAFNWPINFPNACFGAWVNYKSTTRFRDGMEVYAYTTSSFSIARDVDMNDTRYGNVFAVGH